MKHETNDKIMYIETHVRTSYKTSYQIEKKSCYNNNYSEKIFMLPCMLQIHL